MIGQILPIGGIIAAVCGLAYYWFHVAQRDSIMRRLQNAEDTSELSDVSERPFAVRIPWLSWCFALLLAVLLIGLWNWPVNIAVGVAIVFGFVGMELDAWIYQWRLSRIEAQLADAIDVLVASVGAGSSLQSALRQAAEFSQMPLRGEFAEMVARLRLGDSPPDVFDLLAQRVPTEVFRLFSTTLTVNWQVGGELAGTLAAIGTTIRDRLTIARQLRTLSTQGTLTTLTVLAVIWFMAAMMWQADPPRFTAFVLSPVGSWLVAGCLLLQGVGVALVSRISRPRI